jgi:hypothetical protein
MRGIQIGELSKLGWLIGLVKHAIWADSLYFLYLLLLSISKILASSQLKNPNILVEPQRFYSFQLLHGHIRILQPKTKTTAQWRLMNPNTRISRTLRYSPGFVNPCQKILQLRLRGKYRNSFPNTKILSLTI